MTEQPSDTSTAAPRARALSSRGISLGKLFGVGVRIDWSLLIIFALIVFELGAAVFPSWHPEWARALTWTMALAAAVLFFSSILVHELSHAVVARSYGIPVRRITLFLFGGLTQLEGEPASPKAEFWMAIVGPIVSVLIGVLATWGGAALVGAPLRAAIEAGDPLAVQAAMANAGPFATLLLWLGPINLLLGIFNIIPGFPLDGGRVLRSILWAVTGNLRKATRWASGIGQVFAWTLMVIGAINLFGGAWVSGIWLLLIGWFLNNAARMSYQQLLVRQALEHVPVTRVMRSNFVSLPPELSVERFVHDYALTSDQRVYPIEHDGALLGTVSTEQLRKVPRDAWATTSIQQVMIPSETLPTLPAEAGAEQALVELSRGDVEHLVVTEGRRLLGLVRREDIMRWLEFQQWMTAAEG